MKFEGIQGKAEHKLPTSSISDIQRNKGAIVNEIWRISSQHSFFYTEDPKIRDKISRWAAVRPNAWYQNSRGKLIGWQFLIPNKIRRRVAKLAGIDIPKARGRVRMARMNLKAGKGIQQVLKDGPVKIPAATTQ